nr:hypothetical protein [Tanacetum cinerariifolium]
MSTANPKTLAESRASNRPPILEKEIYVPWASLFLRFLENKKEDEELMRHSIDNGPYKRKDIPDPNNESNTIPEPISKMTSRNKNQYFADIRVMNYILQGILNDIYNSVDACPNAKTMWARFKRLTQGTKKATRNHDPLAIVANSHAYFSNSHASPSYSRSPQPYYATHPSSVNDYEDDYQWEIQRDAQEDKLTIAMMNQVVIQDGRVDIQSKNVGYTGNGNKNQGMQHRNQRSSKHMTMNLKRLRNFVEKFMGTVYFGNDNFTAITRHNLFSIGQTGVGDLEVAFHSKTCYVRNLEGKDLLTGSRDSNLYTIPIYEMAASLQNWYLCWLLYVMETIHVKFDELTAMAYECNNLGPGLNCLNFQDSSEELNEIQSKEGLDNLFGPLYEEYYTTRTPKGSNNSATNTLDNKDTHSSSSVIVEYHDALEIVSSSEEPIANEPTIRVFDNHYDEQVQEDIAELDINTFMNLFASPKFKEAGSSLNYQDPSNMHEFHQQHHFTDRWTKNHPIEQVIGDPTKPVPTQSRLHIDA